MGSGKASRLEVSLTDAELRSSSDSEAAGGGGRRRAAAAAAAAAAARGTHKQEPKEKSPERVRTLLFPIRRGN